MPRILTVRILRSGTVRIAVPDDVPSEDVVARVNTLADDILSREGAEYEVFVEAETSTFLARVREMDPDTWRVTDDLRRVTQEEVDWIEGPSDDA